MLVATVRFGRPPLSGNFNIIPLENQGKIRELIINSLKEPC